MLRTPGASNGAFCPAPSVGAAETLMLVGAVGGDGGSRAGGGDGGGAAHDRDEVSVLDHAASLPRRARGARATKVAGRHTARLRRRRRGRRASARARRPAAAGRWGTPERRARRTRR